MSALSARRSARSGKIDAQIEHILSAVRYADEMRTSERGTHSRGYELAVTEMALMRLVLMFRIRILSPIMKRIITVTGHRRNRGRAITPLRDDINLKLRAFIF